MVYAKAAIYADCSITARGASLNNRLHMNNLLEHVHKISIWKLVDSAALQCKGARLHVVYIAKVLVPLLSILLASHNL